MSENNNIDDLLVKVMLGESTAEELREVETWVAESSDHGRYFQDFQRIWEESRRLGMKSTVNENIAWGDFQRRVQEKERTQGRVVGMGWSQGSWWRVAAVFLVLAAGGWFYYTYSYRPAQFFTVASGARVLADTLPEGSVVTLNKESSIRYQRGFAGNVRQVDMKGEAFFAVTGDKNRPFVVNANGAVIKVLGTSFNVNTSGIVTEVIVETGMVEISKDGHTVRVGAHEKAVIGKAGARLVKETNPDQLYNYYRTDAFECNGTPLWRLVEKLNEVYKVHIVIGNERLRDLPLSTTFAGESLDGILDVVSKTFSIKVTRKDAEIFLN